MATHPDSKPESIVNDPRRSMWLWCGVIFFAAWIVYLPALRAGFIWDDQLLVTGNPLLRTWSGLARIWFGTDTPDYFPLTSTTFWIEWHLWGNMAAGYHVVNILLHAIGSILLGFVLSRLRIPGAWLAALVFAIHPVNAASVAWIAERKNNLSMVLYLASILMFLRFEEKKMRGWYLGALMMFLLALLAKTSVVMLPFVLLGCAWWMRGKLETRDLMRNLPFFGLSAFLGLLTMIFQHRAVTSFPMEPLAIRFARVGQAIWFYTGKALFPADLCMIYPEWRINTASPIAWLPLIGVIVALVLFWICRRGWGRPFLFGFGYFVITLAPVLGFIYMTFLAQAWVADWWQYTSIPGLIALVVGLAVTGWRRLPPPAQKVALVLLVLPLGGLGVATWQQATLYHSMETCCRAIIEGNPRAWAAHDNLGNALAARGRTADAIAEYEEALRINPADTLGHDDLAMTFFRLGRFDEAIIHYREIVHLQPEYGQGHVNLASALANRGSLPEAILQFKAALLILPHRLDVKYELANALAMAGRFPEAVEQYREILHAAPDHVGSLNNLARILATNLDPQFRGDEALRDALLANKLTGEKNPAIMNTLAAAYADAGHFEEALRTAHEALTLAREAGRADLVRSIEARLAVYETHQPWRELR